MKIAKIIAIISLLAMTSVIIYAFAAGDFSAEGAWITSHPWGIVSLVDLYAGFSIFSLWIVYREKSPVAAVVWVALMMVLGNWTAALYVLLALVRCRGDWQKFWMGGD
ncbi:MAG: DUF1475 family protein [Anaerolineae bacterium]|nr:DUF1475 family protein [Anaerolineae bacterium]